MIPDREMATVAASCKGVVVGRLLLTTILNLFLKGMKTCPSCPTTSMGWGGGNRAGVRGAWLRVGWLGCLGCSIDGWNGPPCDALDRRCLWIPAIFGDVRFRSPICEVRELPLCQAILVVVVAGTIAWSTAPASGIVVVPRPASLDSGAKVRPAKADSSMHLVAVMDLKGHGLAQYDARLLSDGLSKALAATGRVRTVDRSMVRSSLDPLDHGPLAQCFQRDCAQRAAKELHADHVIVGTVERKGNFYEISLYSVDSAGENSVHILSNEYHGDPDEWMGALSGDVLAGPVPEAEKKSVVATPARPGPAPIPFDSILQLPDTLYRKYIANRVADRTSDRQTAAGTALLSAAFVGIGFFCEAIYSAQCSATNLGNAASQVFHQLDGTTPGYTACDETFSDAADLLFVAGGVSGLASIINMVQSAHETSVIDQIRNRKAGIQDLSLVPWIDPHARSGGLVARVSF